MISRGPGLVLPALAALGIGGPASALELGPAQVQSALGQPLRASIAFALRPFEEIAPHCIRVTSGRSASGLPSAGPASVTLRDGAIYLAGDAPVSEPLLALQLAVDCPYAPHLSREYVVFVDPEQPVEALPASVAARAPARREPAAPRASAPAVQKTPIAAGATYRVERGDTLSDIAERLSGRRVGLWEATELLFAANPQAFMNADPDLLRAGTLLRIPDAVYAAQPAAAAPPAAVPEATAHVAPLQASSAYTGYVPGATTAEPPETAGVPGDLFRDGTSEVSPPEAATVTAPFEGPATAPLEAGAADNSPQPGDVRVDAEGLFVSPAEIEEPAVPAGAAAGTEPVAVAPEKAVAGAPRSESGESDALSWLLWLAGSGVALILGLLLFGRTLKGRFGGRALASGDAFARHGAGDAPANHAEPEAEAINVDFRLDEADARIVRVDVDLDDSSAFQGSGDMDVAQDFGFSASGGLELGLDIDFSDELPAMVDVTGHPREGDVIVEEEIPPDDSATGEYDVSMIVDATRQPLGDTEDTAKDLHAIELASTDTEPEEDPFTLSREVDYKILEQDYEEELTATQALAAELSHAARDLVEHLYDESGETAVYDLPTVEMPAPGTELTAELPRARSGHGDASATVEMLPESAIAEKGDTDVNEELTLLPDAGNDASAEMEIESATVDTKKLRVS